MVHSSSAYHASGNVHENGAVPVGQRGWGYLLGAISYPFALADWAVTGHANEIVYCTSYGAESMARATVAPDAVSGAADVGRGTLAAVNVAILIAPGVPRLGATAQAGAGATRALAARQIQAAWGASVYKHGGLMTGIEHVMYRHSAGSGFANVGRYFQGTTARTVVNLVDEALRYGTVTGTGATSFTIEYNFGIGRAIGTNMAGSVSTTIRIYVRDGIIQSAFPI